MNKKLKKINDYRTLIFDCDGVVLNSNKVKTQAFYNTSQVFGEGAANRLVNYHIERGGISRYEKFQWLLNQLSYDEVKKSPQSAKLEVLLENYAEEVYKGLRKCEIAEGLNKLREDTSNSTWLIVSGGDQKELRKLFKERNISHLFDGGIFGSPDTKEHIISRELNISNIKHPAIFIGDSKYDYDAASQAGLDFVFLTDWTEVDCWKKWVEINEINHRKRVNELK